MFVGKQAQHADGSLLAGSHRRSPGPVLIRGGELVGHDPVKFDEGTPMLFPELQFPPESGSNPGTGSWRNWPTGPSVRAPGCYAWQVDGTTFSYTVALQAVHVR